MPNHIENIQEKITKMVKSKFCCCKVFISEARNKCALESIEQAVKLFPEAVLVNKFVDETYNRVGYTLVSRSSDLFRLKDAIFAMVKAAFDVIDFELHSGNHPRLGVVDHISFLPLASTSLEQVANTAKALAADIGSVLKGLYSLVKPLYSLLLKVTSVCKIKRFWLFCVMYDGF